MAILGADIEYELNQQVARKYQQQIVGLRDFGVTGDDEESEDDARQVLATEQIGLVKLTDEQIVRPGDLITADFINKLLLRLAKLEAIIGLDGVAERGTFEMPYYFGGGLSDAMKSVKSKGLKLRRIVDISGRVLTDSKDATRSGTDLAEILVRLGEATKGGSPAVLGQYPVPKARVKRGESVSLLVNLRGVADAGGIDNQAELMMSVDGTVMDLMKGRTESAAPQPSGATSGTASEGATKTTKKRAPKKKIVVNKDDTKTDPHA